MWRSFVLAALLAACIASGARAQTVEVPRPYAIPLPPTTAPNWELGARYWWSEGKTGFNFTSSKVDPTLGNPTSKLTYDGMHGNSAELFFRATNEGGNFFAKGFVGGGWLNGGSLDDEDFFAGQIKFSDTYSKIKGNSLLYGTIDFGYDFRLLDGATKVTVGPLVGIQFLAGRRQVGYGATLQPGRRRTDWSAGHPVSSRSPSPLRSSAMNRTGRRSALAQSSE